MRSKCFMLNIYNTIWSIFGEMDDIPKNKRNERSEEIGPHLDENDGFLFPFITFVWFIFWRPRSCYVTLFDGHSYRWIIFFFITFFCSLHACIFLRFSFFLFKYTSLLIYEALVYIQHFLWFSSIYCIFKTSFRWR